MSGVAVAVATLSCQSNLLFTLSTASPFLFSLPHTRVWFWGFTIAFPFGWNAIPNHWSKTVAISGFTVAEASDSDGKITFPEIIFCWLFLVTLKTAIHMSRAYHPSSYWSVKDRKLPVLATAVCRSMYTMLMCWVHWEMNDSLNICIPLIDGKPLKVRFYFIDLYLSHILVQQIDTEKLSEKCFGSEDWIQSLVYIKHMLYHWAMSLAMNHVFWGKKQMHCSLETSVWVFHSLLDSDNCNLCSSTLLSAPGF